jgi:hypothetical protein
MNSITIGPIQHFDLPLSFNSERYGQSSTAWSISGHYFTSTDSFGESQINISGNLNSPEELSPDYEHYAAWVFGTVGGGTFWHWSGWEPNKTMDTV